MTNQCRRGRSPRCSTKEAKAAPAAPLALRVPCIPLRCRSSWSRLATAQSQRRHSAQGRAALLNRCWLFSRGLPFPASKREQNSYKFPCNPTQERGLQPRKLPEHSSVFLPAPSFQPSRATEGTWPCLEVSPSKRTCVTFVQKKAIHISQHKSRFCSSPVR